MARNPTPSFRYFPSPQKTELYLACTPFLTTKKVNYSSRKTGNDVLLEIICSFLLALFICILYEVNIYHATRAENNPVDGLHKKQKNIGSLKGIDLNVG